ncbi:MAG: phage protease [Peptococcaceae bacterium]|nr:phage protease [Peptococcaceae bacterium]
MGINDGLRMIACTAQGIQDANMLYGTLIACEAGEGAAVPTEIQFLPYGRTVTDKGEMLVDELAVRELMKFLAAKKNDIVIDYEHQTLEGGEAPAAGWIKEITFKGADGLWARVEWTPRAMEYLRNKEYRYLSPVVWARKSDNRVVYIHSAALTNTPAIDGMVPLVNKVSNEKEEKGLDELLQQMRWMLNLPITATAEEIIAELQKVIEQVKKAEGLIANKEILTLLDLAEDATLDQAKGRIIALKNPSGYVKAEEYNELKRRLDLRDRDDLVSMALKAGKVAPAQKAWAEEYALKDPAGFKAFLEAAPQVVPLEEISGGDPKPAGGKVGDAQLMVNKMLGISDEDFKKYGGEQ